MCLVRARPYLQILVATLEDLPMLLLNSLVVINNNPGPIVKTSLVVTALMVGFKFSSLIAMFRIRQDLKELGITDEQNANDTATVVPVNNFRTERTLTKD